jgi:hypothetical protein
MASSGGSGRSTGFFSTTRSVGSAQPLVVEMRRTRRTTDLDLMDEAMLHASARQARHFGVTPEGSTEGSAGSRRELATDEHPGNDWRDNDRHPEGVREGSWWGDIESDSPVLPPLQGGGVFGSAVYPGCSSVALRPFDKLRAQGSSSTPRYLL